MSLGLNQNSKFESVRRYVIWAATELVKANKLDYSKIDIIKKTFNEVGITEDFYNPEKIDSVVPPTSSDIPVDAEHFPDEAFRQFISDSKIDRDNNKALSPEEVAQATEIRVGNRSISSLQGIEYFTSLKILYCSLNQLTTLDVSNCAQGIVVVCDEGVNVIYPSMPSNPEENPDIPIDKEHFPDVVFRSYVSHFFDKNNDGILNIEEIRKVTSIELSDYTLSSLQGIEYFFNLESLFYTDLKGSGLETLDISKNFALKELYCQSGRLRTLDVSNNIALETLICHYNELRALDVSKNVALKVLACESNYLTVLDVSQNKALEYLSCGSNKLDTLDVSKNIALNILNCSNNSLTSLILGNNTLLETLGCKNNQLTTLDVSNNIALKELRCNNNQLATLDISKNVALAFIECGSNQLTELDVRNCAENIKVYCDEYVQVTYPPSHSMTTSTRIMSFKSGSDSVNTIKTDLIVATLPIFTAKTTGECIFDVSLDRTVST